MTINSTGRRHLKMQLDSRLEGSTVEGGGTSTHLGASLCILLTRRTPENAGSPTV